MKKTLKDVSIKFNIDDLTITLYLAGDRTRIDKHNELWNSLLRKFDEQEIYEIARMVKSESKIKSVLILKRYLNTDLRNAKMIMENL